MNSTGGIHNFFLSCLDWLYRDGIRITFKVDRRRRAQRRHHNRVHSAVRCEIPHAGFRVQICHGPEADELLFENDTV